MSTEEKNGETRSPVDPPLPMAGGSTRDRIIDGIFDLLPSMVVAGALTAWALIEWLRYWFHLPPSPWVMTAMAVMAIAFATWRWRKTWPELGRMSLGMRGERVVAEMLDDLRGRGYRVFHDVEGDGDWNIDHVLIG